MELEIAKVTLVGDRENNEDFVGFVSSCDGAVLVVADGLGGHEQGEWASEAFVEGILAQHPQLVANDYSSRDTAKPVFEAAFAKGREHLREWVRAKNETSDPQTTAVVAVVKDDAIGIAHIGDSRAYRLTRSGVAWRSRDHSLVELLLDQGEITETEMGTHPAQNKLFKSIGMNSQATPSLSVQAALSNNEALLLCSDGFWERLLPDELAGLIAAKNLAEHLTHLAHIALGRAAGHSDNVTALCARAIGKEGALSRFIATVLPSSVIRILRRQRTTVPHG
jgi:serine/threonine protein phosphatase PrpC